MPSNLPRFTIRTEQINIDKISFIAERESRTTTKQIEHLIKSYIEHFEQENGEILIDDNGNISISKQRFEGKSSNTKIG